MSPPHQLQSVTIHSIHAEGVGPSDLVPSPPNGHSDLGSEPESYALPSNTMASSSQHEGLAKARLSSTESSLQSFHTANTSLSCSSIRQTMIPTSTISSNTSLSYSVTSINSYKSRKNVLYPRRAHPPPVMELPDNAVSSSFLFWEVIYLCKALLPHVESRLVPAGMVLLRSLGLQGDFPQRVSVPMNEATRCCSEFFIALTLEVLLKGTFGAGELERPCELLHETFRAILLKEGSFFPLATSNSNEAPRKETPESGRFVNVYSVLCSVIDAFERALNTIEPPVANEGALREHHRGILLKISVSTCHTVDQCRVMLRQKLARAQVQLDGFPRHPEGLLSSSTERGTIRQYQGASRAPPFLHN